MTKPDDVLECEHQQLTNACSRAEGAAPFGRLEGRKVTECEIMTDLSMIMLFGLAAVIVLGSGLLTGELTSEWASHPLRNGDRITRRQRNRRRGIQS